MRVTLRILPTDREIACRKEQCDSCPIGPGGTGICDGFHTCCGSERELTQHACHMTCNECSGWIDDGGNAKRKALAVCGKVECPSSTLLPAHHFLTPTYSVPVLKTPSYVPQIKDKGDGRFLAEHFTWFGVNIRDACNKTGWKSRDIRDYFSLPRSAKVLLHSTTEDWRIDRAQRFYSSVASQGFRAWGPLEFSVYGYEGNLQHFFQLNRTFESANEVSAHFIYYQRSTGFEVDGAFRNWVDNVPTFMLDCSFGGLYEAMIWQRTKLQRMKEMGVRKILLSGLGPMEESQIRYVKSLFSDATFISPVGTVASRKRSLWTKKGRKERKDIPYGELMVRNHIFFKEKFDG